MAGLHYIAIQKEAAEEIVGNRLLQSISFEEGERLAQFLRRRDPDIAVIIPKLSAHEGASKRGIIIKSDGDSGRVFAVFDLQQSGLFNDAQDSGDAVQCLQRVLRFCMKYWSKRVFGSSELVFPSHSKAVVFPFPISQMTGFRITIDLSPDAKRLRQRDSDERYILIFKSGWDAGQGPKETASTTIFKKFIDDLAYVDFSKPAEPRVDRPDVGSMRHISVLPPPGKLDLHSGYDVWTKVLTTEQKRFVQAPLTSPIRIEGPAGTGKTLCLALKAVHELRNAESSDGTCSGLFVTHSAASRRTILSVLESMEAGRFLNSASPRRALKVETLQGLCSDILGRDLAQTELLDPDAYDAKQLQLLYIEEALRRARADFPTYLHFLSPTFAALISSEDEWSLVQMLQHEIGVVVKGRANEQFEIYQRIPSLRSGLPIKTEGDKSFVWRIYELYREQLITGAQFDTDDVMLSALGQLSTPIWRRRRIREGYDLILIDETHLFNMNELSIFHHLTKRVDGFQIAFAVDRSQAIGDRGWADEGDIDMETLVPQSLGRDNVPKVKVSSIFRCSPDIVNLAFSVTSAGASLFTNFHDPLALANSNLSFEEERMLEHPRYVPFESDDLLVEGCFELAERAIKEMRSSRGDMAIIAFSDELFRAFQARAENENKPVEVLKERGDVELVQKAKQSGRFVLSMPDYVGGLEFDGVVLAGVDEGRVPPAAGLSSESKAFLSYTAHNRLYVAITRARYRVVIAGVRARGPSQILQSAITTKSLSVEGAVASGLNHR